MIAQDSSILVRQRRANTVMIDRLTPNDEDTGMDRRRKLINFQEAATRRTLSATAERNDCEVFSKIRVADVLNITGSGINDDLYGYALKAHFDFVVADNAHVPLFAVEFDGPHHETDQRAFDNDRRKNVICERLDFSLARVRGEHLFRKARGTDYLTWLSELFFTFQALTKAQEQGSIPMDEPLDPMLMLSHPNLKGAFPLFISSDARLGLRRLYEARVLVAPVPIHFTGDDSQRTTGCLSILITPDNVALVSQSSIYLRGFGIAPSEAADEIATVNLWSIAREHSETGNGGKSIHELRQTVVNFLQSHSGYGFGGPQIELGFPLRYEQSGGQAKRIFGAFAGEPEVSIPVSHR